MKHAIYILAFTLSVMSCGRHSKNELGLNEEASVKQLGDLPENPLMFHAITSSIYPMDSTTTILYGNDIAYAYAVANGDSNYPVGTVLYEVTWNQHADKQWFGANVPKAIKKIERIEIVSENAPQYALFQGDIPRKAESTGNAERTAFILGQRMAVSP